MTDYNDFPSLMRRIEEIERRLRTQETAPRAAATSVSTGQFTILENANIVVQNENGEVVQKIGKQDDGTFASYVLPTSTAPIPPAPSAPVVESQPGGLNVSWDGTFVDGAAAPKDFQQIEVHVSPEVDFVPDASTLFSAFSVLEKFGSFLSLPAVEQYVRLVTRSQQQAASAPSEQSSGVPLEVVDTDQLNEALAPLEDLPAQVDQALQDVADAEQAAADALAAADAAVTAANGKNKITFSVNAPTSGDAGVEGDTWFRKDGSNNIIGQWLYTGGAWVATAMTDTVIANLDAGKIATGFLSADRIASDSITSVKIAAEAITAAKIAADAVTANKILAGSVTTEKLAALAVTAEKIAANSITASKVAANSITAENLALGVTRTQRVLNNSFETTNATGPSTAGSRVSIPNWSFETGANGTAAAFEYATGVSPRTGNGKAVLTNTGAGDDGVKVVSDPFQVTVNEQLNASIFLMTTVATQNAGAGVYLRFYNAANTLISTLTLFVGYVSGSSNNYAPVATSPVTVPANSVTARIVVQNRRAANTTVLNYMLVDDISVFPVGVNSMDLSPSAFRQWSDLGVITTEITPTWATFPNVEAQNFTVNGMSYLTGEVTVNDSLTIRGYPALIGGPTTQIINAPVVGATFSGAGSLGLTSTISVTAPVQSDIVVEIYAAGLITAGSAPMDFQLWRSGTAVRISRAMGVNNVGVVTYSLRMTAGQTYTFQLVAANTSGAATVTNDSRFTYLTASTRPA